MSAQTYEPLRVVPPLDQQHRMALLLRLRRIVRRARDAALAAPRAAAGFAGRLVRSVRLSSTLGWLRRVAGRAVQPLLSMSRRLGTAGVAAGVTAVITSPVCRQVLNKAGRLLGRALGWVARKTYSLLDQTLRCFGKTGNKAADVLFNAVVYLGGKLASIAAPVVYRIARFTDAQTPQARLLNGIARSYVLHRVFKAFIANPYVRLLVEGFVIPALVDSRVGRWVRQQVRTLRLRATSLREQSQMLSRPATQPARPTTRPEDSSEADYDARTASGEDVAMPLWLVEDDLLPNNRAERRAQQRTKPRNTRHQ